MPKALITGITGQDGSYLAELLLSKGYEVHGLVRRVALEDPAHRLGRLAHIKGRLQLHPGSIESYASLIDIVDRVKPDEFYHLAAQSFVAESFDDSHTTFLTNINGTLNALSAVHNRARYCKFYFAGSSEMFGKVEQTPQTEETKFHPRSPYGITKVTGFEMTRNYRERAKEPLFACSGILFNHESPRRGYEFVTRKITSKLAQIKAGKDNMLVLGNLGAERDWGFAGDYVDAMWRMLQKDSPDDYVVATGITHTVKDFVDKAFKRAGLSGYEIVDLSQESLENADKAIEKLKRNNQQIYIVQHPGLFRPAEVDLLLGDASKARKVLGWRPKISFDELVEMMVDHDLAAESK